MVQLPDLSGLTLIVAEDTDDSLDVLTTFLRACANSSAALECPMGQAVRMTRVVARAAAATT